MFTKIFRGAALAATMALAATPAISLAATSYSSQPTHVDYNTRIEPLYGFGGPFSGTLQLTFNPDGIINGYYRPDDNQNFVPVTGGRNGNDIWLDIGQRGGIHVNGTLENGKIQGTAYTQRDFEQFKFVGSVTK